MEGAHYIQIGFFNNYKNKFDNCVLINYIHNMVFSYGCGATKESRITKNSGKLQAVLMTMAMRWYNEVRIAQWSTSRVSLKATVCCHWTSACAVWLQWLPWGTKSVQNKKKHYQKTVFSELTYGRLKPTKVE